MRDMGSSPDWFSDMAPRGDRGSASPATWAESLLQYTSPLYMDERLAREAWSPEERWVEVEAWPADAPMMSLGSPRESNSAQEVGVVELVR